MRAHVNVRWLSPNRWLFAVATAAALGAAGCGSSSGSDQVNAAVSPQANEVKPAAAADSDKPGKVAQPETEAAEPETEAAELPRGVSAPQPDARDQAPDPEPEEASAKLAAAAPASAPTPAPAKKPAAPVVTPKPAAAAPKPAAAPSASKPAAPKASPASAPSMQPIAPVAVAEVPPPAPPPPAAPPPKASVIVPHTDHVHVDVPAGLQHWLDEDDRMRPWLGKAVNVADSCYAKIRADEPGASGAISFTVTMHENARPSGSVGSVSSPISGIVMCATRQLLGVKMPLFTGKEGESYTVRVRFDP